MKRTAPAHGPLERLARAALRESGSSMRRLEQTCAAAVAAAVEAAIACLENGGTLYFCGNGGSAADAQHFACELAGRFLRDRPSLPALALTTNTSSMTAIGNDYGYDHVFARQLEGLGTRGDVLVAITTSGASRSVTRAVAVAKRLGMVVIGMTGAKGGEFAAACDYALITPSFVTPRVQEGHLAMGHAFCELIEQAMFEPPHAARTAAPPPRARSAAPKRARPAAAKPARRGSGTTRGSTRAKRGARRR